MSEYTGVDGDDWDGGRLGSTGQSVTLEKPAVIWGLLAFHAVAMVAALLPDPVPGVVTAPPVVLSLTFVPGGLALLMLYEDVEITARKVLYALGISLISLLAMGFVINVFLPLMGIENTLSTVPLAVSVTLVVGGLAAAVLRGGADGSVTIPVPLPLSPALVFVALLPLLSILTVTYLNVTGDNLPILLLLAVLAIVPLVTIFQFDVQWHSYAVWFLALAVSYHKSFWKNFGFSGSPGVIRSWQAKRWTPGVTEVHPYSTELLQNGVLFPTYARLSGITIITELEVVNPFFIVFIPLAVFVAARQYFGSRQGVLAAALFTFAHPFYIQYPTAGRAATPVLFLSLFAVVLTDEELSSMRASILGLLFAAGIIVSHYATTYFVMFAILGALTLLFLIRYLDKVIDDYFAGTATDGGLTPNPGVDAGLNPIRHVLRMPLALYYTAGSIGWYLYATDGEKYGTLPNHIVSSVSSLMGEEVVSGRTGARLQRDYGSLSVTLSKIMYAFFGMLMGFGLLYAFYRRFLKRDRSFVDDQYVTLASIMLAIFGSTFVARNWGGGRPMMITFTFTTTFSVLGAIALVRAGTYVENKTLELGFLKRWSSRTVSSGAVVFGALLIVLFSLNSGLASSAVVDGRSPSNVPWTEAQDSDRQIDIASHAWVNDHGSGPVFVDRISHGQTDWLLPEIEMETEVELTESEVFKQSVFTLNESTFESEYIQIISHNIKDRTLIQPATRSEIPMSNFSEEFRNRHKIYSTNLSTIYYGTNDTSYPQ